MLWNIILIVGIALVLMSVTSIVQEWLWLRKAQFGSGVVIDLVAASGGLNRRTNVAPRVQFMANDGSEHEFTLSYNSYPLEFEEGEVVAVAYDPVAYKGRILTFGQRFGGAAIFGMIGICCSALALVFMRGDQIIASMCQH